MDISHLQSVGFLCVGFVCLAIFFSCCHLFLIVDRNSLVNRHDSIDVSSSSDIYT